MIAVTQENSCGNQQAIPAGELLDLQHLLQENRTLRWDRNFYKSLLERATAREQLLKQEIQQLNARIRYLEKRLYGRKSEKRTSNPKSNSSTASSSDGQPKRSRGHQPGSPGHGRRDYSHLPVQEEIFGLDEAVCPHCGCPYQEYPFLGTEDSELIEVKVHAYRRKLMRKKYYGSGSVASGHFTACLFSIFQTLKLWNVNPRKWLTQYLQACADNRGQVPDDLTCFLPWTMSTEQLARQQYPDTS